MLDPTAVTRLVEEQIRKSVDEQVVAVLTSAEWLEPLEQKILQYTQDRILTKFANSGTVPEIVEAVKNSVAELFATGQIPGIDQYVDQIQIDQAIDVAVQEKIVSSVDNLAQDPVWLEKIEHPS